VNKKQIHLNAEKQDSIAHFTAGEKNVGSPLTRFYKIITKSMTKCIQIQVIGWEDWRWF
jgi:hypothetical protein